jgi:hypothetical protein
VGRAGATRSIVVRLGDVRIPVRAERMKRIFIEPLLESRQPPKYRHRHHRHYHNHDHSHVTSIIFRNHHITNTTAATAAAAAICTF